MIRNLTGQVVKSGLYSFAFGGSADMWEGEMTHESTRGPTRVAVKVFRGPADQTMLNRIFREMRVWHTVKHSHITPLFGISLDFDRPDTPCLVFPYYNNGNIMDYLKTHPDIGKLPLITQIANALSYLHDQSVIHGDIKGSNVLINDSGDACLVDLGLARILGESGFTTKTASSTFRFMSPELIPREAPAGMVIPRVTAATDIWAFSMCVIEVMTQRIPFWHIGVDASVVVYVAQGGRPRREHCKEINDKIWATLETCWHVGPEQRPGMAQLFEFFKSQVSSSSSSGLSHSKLESA